jgi:uncharacterized protein with PQ loop repeat
MKKFSIGAELFYADRQVGMTKPIIRFFAILQTHLKIYYTKNQQDATLAVLFISNCKITLHVSDAYCVHHQEY